MNSERRPDGVDRARERDLASAALLACIALSAACSSLSTLHTARPVPVGETEGAVAFGAYVFEDDDGDRETSPQVEVQARRGFAPRFDAGFKVSSLSLFQIDANYAFYESERFALALDPTFAVMPVAEIFVTYVWLPLLFDVVASEDLTFVFAAKIGQVSVDELGGEDFGIDGSGRLYGFGIGAKIRTGARVRLFPEINVVIPESDVSDTRIYSVSLGFLF